MGFSKRKNKTTSVDRKTTLEKFERLYDLLACLKCGLINAYNYRNGICEHVLCSKCLSNIISKKRIGCGAVVEGSVATPCEKLFVQGKLVPETDFNEKFQSMIELMDQYSVSFDELKRPKPLRGSPVPAKFRFEAGSNSDSHHTSSDNGDVILKTPSKLTNIEADSTPDSINSRHADPFLPSFISSEEENNKKPPKSILRSSPRVKSRTTTGAEKNETLKSKTNDRIFFGDLVFEKKSQKSTGREVEFKNGLSNP